MEQGGQPPEKKELSRKFIASVAVAIVIASSVVGVFMSHWMYDSGSQTPSHMLLPLNRVNTVMHDAAGYSYPAYISDSNIAGTDYSNGTHMTSLTDRVSSPNLLLLVMKEKTNGSASSEYNSLWSMTQKTLDTYPNPYSSVTTFSISGLHASYFDFFNKTSHIGAVVERIYSYVAELIVYNVPMGELEQLALMQGQRIADTVQEVNTHFLPL